VVIELGAAPAPARQGAHSRTTSFECKDCCHTWSDTRPISESA
jgi:hypothetical protein